MPEPNSSSFEVLLTREPLSVEEARESVMRGNVGAVSVFIGSTRARTEGKARTIQLEYDCYEEMAVGEMGRICRAALDRWSLEAAYVSHRLGTVPVREASVVIATSSEHRKEAMDACRFLIDALKQSVPIWKKEVYADGTTEWVDGSASASQEG